MSQGDIKAFIDEQIKQFLAFGREDLAEQVERAIALVAEGKCSAGVCYTIFESAKRELLNLSNDYDAAKNKKKRARRKTVAVVPGALPRRGRRQEEESPPSATPNAGAATIKIKAPAGMTLEEGVPELLQEAATEIRARILYHVLRIIEQRTEPLHPRERPTTYPMKELENIVYAQPPAEQAVEHTDDYALEQAKPADKKRRKKKKKKTVSRQQSATPPAGVRVDFALLYQAIQLGVCNPGERLDLKLPAHLLTRFELTWMRSQKK
jgi:hypothetical protein